MLKRNITILYGSQTGCAEEAANEIRRQAKNRFFVTSCKALNDFDISSFPYEELCVFVCSTSGQGEMPDNMRDFWRFLCRRDIPAIPY